MNLFKKLFTAIAKANEEDPELVRLRSHNEVLLESLALLRAEHDKLKYELIRQVPHGS